MNVMPIDNYISPKTTGYATAAGVVLTTISGCSKNKCIKKCHKPMAVLTVFLTALHIGLIEYNHYKWKHKQM